MVEALNRKAEKQKWVYRKKRRKGGLSVTHHLPLLLWNLEEKQHRPSKEHVVWTEWKESKKEKISRPLMTAIGKSSSSLLAGLTSLGCAALTKPAAYAGTDPKSMKKWDPLLHTYIQSLIHPSSALEHAYMQQSTLQPVHTPLSCLLPPCSSEEVSSSQMRI